MQLEFDFTFWIFCDLVDNDSGDIVGGACLECYIDSDGCYYLTEWEIANFEFSPFFPLPCKECA